MDMEGQVLDVLNFLLSVPIVQIFLRNYISAAQSSCKVPVVELEFLSNYLAELTLTKYGFLKFMPSLIAASAVFLAKWTLDQNEHPWNPTLEHYTNYNASELIATVLALQYMQLNSTAPLHAIRQKYRQKQDLARDIREFRSPTEGETRMFYEIVVAPGYTEKGLEILRGKSKIKRLKEFID